MTTKTTSPAQLLKISRSLESAAFGAQGGAVGAKNTEARKLASKLNGKKGGKPTNEERERRKAEVQNTEACPTCGAHRRSRCKDASGAHIDPHKERVATYKWRQKKLLKAASAN